MSFKEPYLQLLAPVLPMETPIRIDRGDGSYLVGPDGWRYLELVVGTAVHALGYEHPAVASVERSAPAGSD